MPALLQSATRAGPQRTGPPRSRGSACEVLSQPRGSPQKGRRWIRRQHHEGVAFARNARQGVRQEVVKDDSHIIASLRDELARQAGPRRAAVWLGSAVALALESGDLRLTLPNQFHLDFVRRTLRGEIEAACRIVLGRVPKLEWTLQPSGATTPEPRKPGELVAPCRQDAASTGSPPAEPGGTGPGSPALAQASALESSTFANPVGGDPATSLAAPSAAGRAANGPAEGSELDQFASGQNNRLTLTIVRSVITRPGVVTPLLLHGPTGVGKTMLLESLCQQFRRSRPGARVVCLTAEQFTTLFLGALRGGGLPNFRHKYRGLDLLAIDDAQFFLGKRATLEEVLHTLKTLTQQRRQIVLTSDRPLEALGELGPELVERLRGGMPCRVDPPDLEARGQIVLSLAHRLGLALPEPVAQYLAAECHEHARQIQGALHRLDALRQALRLPVTVELATRALSELGGGKPRPVSLGEVERAVRDALGLGEGQLRGGGRTRRLTQVRTLAMFLARKHTPAALGEIGRYFGVRSHSSVITAERKVADWLASSAELEFEHRRLAVRELIQRVESRLRVVG